MSVRITTTLMVAVGGVLTAAGCRPASSPQALQHFQSAPLFTCCNIHYERDEISDANYWIGKTLPAGTPVEVEKVGGDSVTFTAGGVRLTLTQQFGKEPLQQYVDKVLVPTNPRPHIDAYRAEVRRAIDSGKVERGMTREQVIASLGYPPTHKTPSIQDSEWTYWYNRWVSYKVLFDDSGKVADVVGRPAPTAELAIPNAEAPAKPAKKPKKKDWR